MRRRTAVLLYPGCVFLEIAPAVELLAEHCDVVYYTPDGGTHSASNGARIAADGSFAAAADSSPHCVIVPGGNPDSIIDLGTANQCLAAAQSGGAILAGICAGGLVLARAGLLRGRRATHNYTPEHASPDVVACTAPIWEGIIFERADVVVDLPFITAQHWAREVRRHRGPIPRRPVLPAGCYVPAPPELLLRTRRITLRSSRLRPAQLKRLGKWS